MNVEAYTLDALRQLVRDLLEENQKLRDLLHEKNVSLKPTDVFDREEHGSDAFDPDQGGRILPLPISEGNANRFLGRFWGRLDVFARRGGKGGYYPQCDNRWKDICPRQKDPRSPCDICAHQSWQKLENWHIMNHLRGSREDGTDCIGVYPLWKDSSCRFLVFDFDHHGRGAEKNDFANEGDSWKAEVESLRRICSISGVPALVERSRSGNGAHVWIFFSQSVPAVLARQFGFCLLDKGALAINLTSFRFYDRMYPSQDVANSLGNLIALPLQGQALKKGNSAFIDESWNAYPDQWAALMSTPRLSLEQIQTYLTRWTEEMTGQPLLLNPTDLKERPKPWRRDDAFSKADVSGVLHMVLADGIYVDALNLKPGIQNRIRCLATIDNPEFYKNLHSGRSNYYIFSTISLARNTEGYIRIPRGLEEKLLSKCKEAGIQTEIQNKRQTGNPIRVSFRGELFPQQKEAVKNMLKAEHGILNSATGSGKTVISSYVIAEKKVNTLILVYESDMVDQWKEALEKFLEIDEPLPDYQTPSGRVKKRDSVIGTLKGGKDKTTGIIDIAMVGSAFHKGSFFSRIDSYGLVIMDECHHAASAQAQAVLTRVPAKYVYGVSATPVRSDRLEKINYMLLGPILYEYTAKEHARDLCLDLKLKARFTRAVMLTEGKLDYQAAMTMITGMEERNQQILKDVRDAIAQGRSAIILTRRVKHAEFLYSSLKEDTAHAYLLLGGRPDSENQAVRKEIDALPPGVGMALVATEQKAGEGFDCKRLDTLFLAAPIKFDGKLEQCVGRMNRRYEFKKDIIVYDYVDSHIGVFDSHFKNRLKTYKKLGYRVLSEEEAQMAARNMIFDHGNYTEAFEQDLAAANQSIVIASPDLIYARVRRFLELIRSRQEAGVDVSVITTDPEDIRFGDSEEKRQLIQEMRQNGVMVLTTGDEAEHFAVIDRRLVWHGGMNLLGKEDVWDNLIRIPDGEAAAVELLGLTAEIIESERDGQEQGEKPGNKAARD